MGRLGKYMKCNRYAVYGWKLKSSMKNKPRLLYSFKNTEDVDEYRKQIKELFKAVQPCEGNIISQVELEFIPYYGGVEPNIEIRFRCNKCGYEYAGDFDLPYDLDTLNRFLTKIIKEI